MQNRVVVLLLTLLLTISSSNTAAIDTNSQAEPVKNIILLIGDGMGYEHIRLGSYVEYGNDSGMFMQRPEFFQGNVSTRSADEQITDSAASATAIATGYKTNNGMLGMLPNGTSVQTILEMSESNGKQTGLVTSTFFYHATPAAFASHKQDRNAYQQIIPDILDSGADVIMGGGFHISTYPQLIGLDNLKQENNYTQISQKAELSNLDNSTKYLGTFGSGHLPYEADINVNTDIRLHQLADAALNRLSSSQEGFFLMIEGGRIDHAGHEKNYTRDALEVIEFDRTIKLVYDWVKDNPDTLVLITADHETGGLVIDSTSGLDQNLPQNEPTESAKQTRRLQRVKQIEASYTADYHTSQDVALFAFGSSIPSLFTQSHYDNTDIFRIMSNAQLGNFEPVETTTPTTSDTANVLLVPMILIILLPIIKRRKFN